MKSPSGVRIVVAAIAALLALVLAIVAYRSTATANVASKPPALTSPVPTRPVPPSSNAQVTVPPAGFTNFRMRYPGEMKDSAPAFATSDQVDLAHRTNTAINNRITWKETRLWTIAPDGPAHGDCKTFALTKRHALTEEGVPDGALRLVIVYAARYREKHMVLEMRAPDGVYVLDSLANHAGVHFYPAAQMPQSYAVLSYQTWGKPDQWMAPLNVAAKTVAALRRLHEDTADNGLWVYGPRQRGLRQATAMRVRR